jgi:hypothetical protein
MFTEINDLERLVADFQSERVLVGPLMSLRISASYRYFYLAGNGKKTYQSIGLGFCENESHAQQQRADLIEDLKSRFAQVEAFDSHTEMARAVHTHWPTEEAARVLAAAESEARAHLPRHPDGEIVDGLSGETTLRNEQSERLAAQALSEPCRGGELPRQNSRLDDASVGEEQCSITLNQRHQPDVDPATIPERTKLAGQEGPNPKNPREDWTALDQFRELARRSLNNSRAEPSQVDGSAFADAADLPAPDELNSMDGPTEASRGSQNDSGPSKDWDDIKRDLSQELIADPGRHEAGSIRLPVAATLPPLIQECGDTPGSQQHRDIGSTQDDIASAILKLASLAERPSGLLSVELNPTLSENPALWAQPARSNASNVSVPAVTQHHRGPSIGLSFAAVIAAAMIAFLVVPNTRRGFNDAGYAILGKLSMWSSNSAAAVPSLSVAPRADAGGAPRQIEASRRTVPPPPAAAPQRASSEANAPPVSDRQHPVAQEPMTADHSKAKAIRKLVGRRTASPIGAPVTQATQIAAVESGAAPVNGLRVPAQEESTIGHLNPDEIAILLSRGMDLLKSGDFASARLSLRRAAEAGNAEAALTLGSTYDPSAPRQLGGGAIGTDVAQARYWYEKAVHFGSAAAARRLANLPQPQPDRQSAP